MNANSAYPSYSGFFGSQADRLQDVQHWYTSLEKDIPTGKDGYYIDRDIDRYNIYI